MIKESLSVKIGILIERVDNLINSNNKEHIEIIKSVENLCETVNHQHEDYEKRITVLENDTLALKNRYEGRMELFKWTSLILGIILGTIALLRYMGIV